MAGVVLISVPTKHSRSSWVVFLLARSLLAQLYTRVVLSSGKAIVFPTVFQRNPRWVGKLLGSKIVFTQFIDHPQHMNTKAISWISKIALHLHRAWFMKSSMNAVKLMPLPWRNLTIGATMWVNIRGEHFSPKGETCHSYSFPLHLNLRNFLTWSVMGTWRKASLRSNPAHMEPCWNHFLTDLR